MNPLTVTTPTDREVVITRTFNAARRAVFDALTQPDLIKRWLFAPGRTLTVCDVDLRPGGGYRYLFTAPGKSSIGVRGTYREVSRNERLVNTETWDDWDAGETLATTTLASPLGEDAAKTTLTIVSLFPTKHVRDTVLKAGLEKNAVATYSALADVLGGAKVVAGFGLIA